MAVRAFESARGVVYLLFLFFMVGCGGDSNSPSELVFNGTIRFESSDCQCVVGPIRVFVDEVEFAPIQCPGQSGHSAPPGEHLTQACDDEGCWGEETVTVTENGLIRRILACPKP